MGIGILSQVGTYYTSKNQILYVHLQYFTVLLFTLGCFETIWRVANKPETFFPLILTRSGWLYLQGMLRFDHNGYQFFPTGIHR